MASSDIVVSNFDCKISVFLNKGGGVFTNAIVTPINSCTWLGAITAGDFNEDGKADVIVSANGSVAVLLLGNGDGTVSQQPSVLPNSSDFFQARVADLNGDRRLDLATSEVGVAFGNGDGTFQPMISLNVAEPVNIGLGSYFGIDLGDFNGDGKEDIIAANYGEYFAVFAGDGTGRFAAPSLTPTSLSGPESVAAGDFNADGKMDILVGYAAPGPGASTSVDLLLGNGDGTFNTKEIPLWASNEDVPEAGIAIRTADLNNDGKPDAVIADYASGQVLFLLNDGTGLPNGNSAAPGRYLYSVAPGLVDVAVGDLNGDGLPDVAVVNDSTNQVFLFLSQQ